MLEVLPPEAGSWNLKMGFPCSAVGAVDVGPLVAEAEVTPNMALDTAAGLMVFIPKMLPVPVLEKTLEGVLFDEADMFWCTAVVAGAESEPTLATFKFKKLFDAGL